MPARPVSPTRTAQDLASAWPGSDPGMNELTPPDLDHSSESPQGDGLWSEALSGLAMIGAVVLLVFVLSFVGR